MAVPPPPGGTDCSKLDAALAEVLRRREPGLSAARGDVLNHILQVDHYVATSWYFVDAYGIYPMLAPAAGES